MVRIATLNQNQPGLSSDDLSDVGAPVEGKGREGQFKVNVWEALRGWGQRLYRKADIVFLQEVRHAPHVRFLAQPEVSGLLYHAVMQEEFYARLAILSRYPLSNIQSFRWDNNYTLCATATIENIPHLLVSVHWGPPAHEEREAARRLIALIRAANMPTFVGGDLNMHSGYGTGFAPPEYMTLTMELRDIYTITQRPPSDPSVVPIDYLFFRGDYEPVEFKNNDSLDKEPSDHPFLIARLKPRWVNRVRITTSRAPVTATSPRTDELLVMGITDESIDNGQLMYAHWAPTSGWRGWHPLKSGWQSRIASAPPESFIGSAVADGRTYVFWVGADGWVLHKWLKTDNQSSILWVVGNSNAPALNGLPGGAVHAVSCQPGMLHFFYSNRNGHILVARYNIAGGTWPEHQRVLGGKTLPGGHVTAVTRRPGQIDVFTVGTDGKVYTAAWNSQNGWWGWRAIGNVIAKPGTYVGAVSRNLDHLDIFVADTTGRTMSASWDPASGWQGWWHIQGMRTGSTYVTAVSRSIDKLDIFTTGIDLRIYTAAWEPGRNWRGWWPINNAKTQSPVWPVSRSPDKLDVFFVNPDGTIQTAAWEPAGHTWGGPWTINDGWGQ